jgi:ABC-type transport system involved in multi-copper enzyme maturation permease subunit
LAAYFVSPIAYVVLVVFLAVTGHLFYLTLEQLTNTGPEGVEYPMRSMFGDERFWLVFLFIPPLITMRSFAEERASGTLEMLMTSPLRDWQIVMSKFAACFAFYVLLWVPTLAYMPILMDLKAESPQFVVTPYSVMLFAGLAALLLGLLLLVPRVGTPLRLVSVLLVGLGTAAAVAGGMLHCCRDETHLLEITARLDPAPVLTLYLGMMLAGAMFLAMGLFVSSLVRDQLVSAIIALLASLVFVVAGFWKPELDSGNVLDQLVYFFSVPLHFSKSFTRGLIDTRPLVLYSSTTIVLLFLTVRSLESRRWR